MKRVTFALLLSALLTPVVAQEKKESLTVVVRRMLALGDSYRVLEFIQSLGDAEKVSGLYGALAHHYARNENDLALSVAMAQAGIRYALTVAQQIAEQDPEGAGSLRAQAKTIAYNLAANTWPGWGEEGVEPTPQQIAIGWDAAKLNLRLAVALKKGPKKEAHAYWIIGAHELAAGRYDAAAGSELMAQGYRAVARILADDTPERRAELEQAKAALQKRADEGDEDAGFYLPQLDTALRVFLKRRAG
jgi:hypothetical protein